MKATWGIAAALLLVAAAAMDASAKGWGGKKGFHGKCSGHKGGLIEQLDLTEDQQAQFQTLKEDLREQQQALGEQFRTDFEAILTDEQLATLEDRKNPLGLSEDQQAQIDALKDQDLTKEEFHSSFEAILTDDQRDALAERKANRGKHGKRGKHKDSPVNPLGLSDDQQEQLNALKEDLREQKQALGEQFRTDFEAILTADQLATLEAIKAKRGSKDEAKTTETAAAGKATTSVEETSWGRVKGSFGQ